MKVQNRWEDLFEGFLDLTEFTLIKYSDGWGLYDRQCGNLGDIESDRFDNASDIFDRMDTYITDYFYNPNNPQRRRHETCSTSMGDLKLMYDGTIIMCQNSIYDTMINKEYLDNSVDNQGRYHWMTHGQMINPLTATEEEITKYFTYIHNLRKPSNFRFIYITTFNLMVMLARLGQISPEYATDLRKTKVHAFMMARTTCCYYNMQVMCGTLFVRQTGEIRQLCNGIMDRIEKYLNMMGGPNKEKYMRQIEEMRR